MKLALKIVSVLMVGIAILLATGAYLSVVRERNLFTTDMAQDANLFGNAVKGPIGDVWKASGEVAALRLISDMNLDQHPMKIRWVWLDSNSQTVFSPLAPHNRLLPALEGKSISLIGKNETGKDFLLTYIPVPIPSQRLGALEIAESLDAMSKYIRTTIVGTLLLATTILILAGIWVSTAGYSLIGRKLRYLAQHARSIGEGNLSSQLVLPGRDELTELGTTMNLMCRQLAESREKLDAETAARITALLQLRHEDRLRTVGRLASGLAHELGTPLNVVSGRAGLIAAGAITPTEITESASIIKNQAERMAGLIRQLLTFARKGSASEEPLDLVQLVRQTINLLSPLAQKYKADVQVATYQQPVQIHANSGQVQQVLMNIITNALQAIKPEGHIYVTVDRFHKTTLNAPDNLQSYARIDVIDDGCGIAENHLPHIFEPFFTTKDVGEGTGLGLSISYGIVREYGGWIEATSEIGKGSQFSIFLPEEYAHERATAYSR